MKRRHFVAGLSAVALQGDVARAQTDPARAKATQAVLDTVSPVFWFQLPAQVKLPLLLIATPFASEILFITTIPLLERLEAKLLALPGAKLPPDCMVMVEPCLASISPVKLPPLITTMAAPLFNWIDPLTAALMQTVCPLV